MLHQSKRRLMSSFFTLPASQRKRKREETGDATASKRKPPTAKPSSKPQGSKSTKPKRDESISSGASEDEGRVNGDDREEIGPSSDSEDDETGAERRLRLAEQYLENIKGEVDEVGFDAEDIDRDLIAERLQEDVVGKIV